MKSVIVIGAGLGGLSAAVRLQHSGLSGYGFRKTTQSGRAQQPDQ
jgi:cation diffusion facilitator CzcD-associated flavoprotein CzcO